MTNSKLVNSYTFSLSDYEPISLNSAYIPVGHGRFFPRQTTTAYKEAFKDLNKDKEIPNFNTLSVSYIYLFPEADMFYKNGRLKRKDISNYIKILEDALMDILNNDDSYVLSLSGHKRISPDDRYHCICIVSETTLDTPIYHDLNAVGILVVDNEVLTTLLPT